MKNSTHIAVVFLIFIILDATASTYISLGNGYTLLNDANVKAEGIKAGTLSYDAGVSLEAAIGRSSPNKPLRSEISVFYQKSDTDTFKNQVGVGPSGRVIGDQSILAILLGGFFDIQTDTPFTPFVLLGAGVAHVDIEIENGNGSDTVAALQFGVGAGYALSDASILDLEYRLFSTSATSATVNGTPIQVDIVSHSLMASFRFLF